MLSNLIWISDLLRWRLNITPRLSWVESPYVSRNVEGNAGHDIGVRRRCDTGAPYIDSTFRTHSDRDHHAMAGLSMGGMQTLLCGARTPPLNKNRA
jgi:hypothetical protein